MKSVALNGNKRADRGTSNAKALRTEGKLPAVLYGGKENTHFTVNEVEFEKIINSPNVYFVELDVEGTKHKAIIKDVQFHPVTDRVIHIDFLEVVDGAPFTVNIPVKITGQSKGVLLGGKLRTVTRRLKVRGLAEAMPEFIEVDITPLKIGDSIKVADLSREGLDFLDASNAVVVAVKMSRAAMSASGDDEEEEGAEEGEATEAAAE